VRTQLWNDVWIKHVPLRICFPSIFVVCEDTSISVARCAEADWEIHFRRMLGDMEFREMQSILRGVTLSNRDDEIDWGLTANK
jgi:hypothetical protein